LHSQPSPDQIEVSIFGPGYGEGILIRVPPGDWILVDCCVDQSTKKPAPLVYLESLGVDPATDVKLIVATHWHDDHIRGLSKVVSSCPNAQFAMSTALQCEEFTNLVYAMGERTLIEGGSGVAEFNSIISQLFESQRVPILASENKTLWTRREVGQPTCQVTSLSPSDRAYLQVIQDFSSLFPEEHDPKRRVLPKIQNKNHISVTLWVQIDEYAVLLGADLEDTSTASHGWGGIANSPNRPQGKAIIYKIPHHGSETAENADVWDLMLEDDPLSLCTPFNHGTSLPKGSDVERICSRTSQAYITSSKKVKSSLLKSKDRQVEKLLKNSGIKFLSPPLETGLVRTRFFLNAVPSQFPVELFSGACRLDEF